VSQLTCQQCGGRNEPGARVCSSCGYYLAESGSTSAEPPPGPSGPSGNADEVTVAEPEMNGPQAGFGKPPRVSVADPDVVLDPEDGNGFDLRVFNPSSIVEGYRLDPVAPPPWLTISQPAIRLLPGEQTVARVDLGVRPDTLVIAQRLRLPLRVHLLTDATVYAEVDLTLTVPPTGGPALVRTDPAVVRLQDTRRGRFTVHLDNRGCNHPQRYRMSGSDDEGVVRFTFTPTVIEVAPGGSAVVGVDVDSPAPAPG
jgi:hypothetical protein